jgi:trehalose-6-phosphate synthase
VTVAGPTFDLVVAANRLPVERVLDASGRGTWQRSPGGLVTALESVMTGRNAAWAIMQTVRLVAKDGWRLLGDNRFEPPRASGGTARDRSRLPRTWARSPTTNSGSRGTRDTTTTRRSPSSSATSRRPRPCSPGYCASTALEREAQHADFADPTFCPEPRGLEAGFRQ